MGNQHIWILFLPSPSHHFNTVIEDDSAQCPPYSLLHHLRFSTPTLIPKNTEQQEAGSYWCHVTVSSHLLGHAQHGPTLPDTTSAHDDDNVLCVRMLLQWMWWGQRGKHHTSSSLPLPTVNASVIHCGYHPHVGAIPSISRPLTAPHQWGHTRSTTPLQFQCSCTLRLLAVHRYLSKINCPFNFTVLCTTWGALSMLWRMGHFLECTYAVACASQIVTPSSIPWDTIYGN